MNLYIKSLIWLVSLGGVGYGLQLLTTPSAEKLQKIKHSGLREPINEEERKKALFMQHFKEAASSADPIYLKKKDN